MLLDLTLTDDEDAASTVGQETGVPFSHKLAIVEPRLAPLFRMRKTLFGSVV
jgi:hypothetical protein